MACRISELVIDCRDPQRLAAFWCEVLGFIMLDTDDDGAVEIGPREGFGGLQPTLVFSPTTEPKAGKPRLHSVVSRAGQRRATSYDDHQNRRPDACADRPRAPFCRIPAGPSWQLLP